MAKWAIELGEHDIEFRVRHAIKGQVLADFITETDSVNEEDTKNSTQVITPKIESEEWKLYTDGASSSDGSGAGLMLVNPKGKEFTYALRFEFATTNNEAEYEALLERLRMEKELKILHLRAFVDSQLVSNQIRGTFEAKQPTIQQYLSKAKELIESFKTFDIEHVRRSQNKKADALSKLASLTFEHLAKEVLVEVLEKKSILEEEVNDLVQEDEVTWMTPLAKARNCHNPRDARKDMWSSRRSKVEVTNRDIIKGIEKRLGKCRKGWVDELPLVLWAHRTTPKRNNGETPYSLAYGTEAVLPAEIQVLTERTANNENNEENLRVNLYLLEEKTEAAVIREASYKQMIEGYYNKRVKPSTFKVGEYVLRLNSASKVEYEGKLGPNWEGPYVISQVLGKGSYKLETTIGKPIPRARNTTNLEKFYH
ncbi:uncharacterized protein [Rutidosis leptorrhynchoides]|uniref:uncharacterized protein n=1 Tax=Rutidosis leptorrhynchoides TaxID=125765 RepID=UPI003A992B0D